MTTSNMFTYQHRGARYLRQMLQRVPRRGFFLGQALFGPEHLNTTYRLFCLSTGDWMTRSLLFCLWWCSNQTMISCQFADVRLMQRSTHNMTLESHRCGPRIRAVNSSDGSSLPPNLVRAWPRTASIRWESLISAPVATPDSSISLADPARTFR